MTQQLTHKETGRSPSAAADSAMWVSDLSKSFGDVRALYKVDFHVAKGEVFGLLGPNGAGKTTLAEILEGHIKPSTGTVRVLGMEPSKAGRSVRDRLGIVPQKASFELYLTVREHLAAFAGYYSRTYSVDDVLDLVGLSAQSQTKVGRLSGGQQRRLDLALAIVGDPDIVFLDEPTTGLDIEARDRAWDTIAAMRAMGKTIFLTTHNMTEAQRLCDRVAVLYSGEIAAIGQPSRLLPDDHGGTISFRAEGVTVDSLPGDLPAAARATGDRITIHVDRTPQALHALTGWAVDNDIALADLEVRRPDLEELYLSILARQEREAAEGATS